MAKYFRLWATNEKIKKLEQSMVLGESRQTEYEMQIESRDKLIEEICELEAERTRPRAVTH